MRPSGPPPPSPYLRCTPALTLASMQLDLSDRRAALLAQLSPLSSCIHGAYLPAGTQLQLRLDTSKHDEVRHMHACMHALTLPVLPV